MPSGRASRNRDRRARPDSGKAPPGRPFPIGVLWSDNAKQCLRAPGEVSVPVRRPRFADERPLTVKGASLTMAVGAVLVCATWFFPFTRHRFVSAGVAEDALLTVVVVVLLAWSVASLNGAAYLLCILATGLGLLPDALAVLMAVLHLDATAPLEWKPAEDWIQSVAMALTLLLLVMPRSVKAPWSLMNGFSL